MGGGIYALICQFSFPGDRGDRGGRSTLIRVSELESGSFWHGIELYHLSSPELPIMLDMLARTVNAKLISAL